LFAQSIEIGLSKLAEKGISEQDFRDAMLAKGYDVDNIKPEEAVQIQPIIEATIKELAVKKAIENKLEENQTSEIPKLSPKPSEELIKELQGTDLGQRENLENTIYGHHLFLNNSIILFENVKGVKPPQNYILGVRDEISVSIFGASQADFKYTIDEEGAIRPTGLGKVFLKGNTVLQAEKILRAKFAQAYVFSPEQFSVSLLSTRNILVSVLGEVNQPGTFSVSAANSAINVLMLAKGLTKDGGVRSIKVISGSSVKELDLYEYINNPSIVDNFYLSDNDMIVVPLAQKVVDLKGAVKRPYKYELKPNENLKVLLNYAGGFQANAKRDILQINRYDGNDCRY
jgi:polysaccharide biosynthesis/export protein